MLKCFVTNVRKLPRVKGANFREFAAKKPETSTRMDQLLYATCGMAIVNNLLREKGESSREASRFIVDALFVTITNANFDNAMLDVSHLSHLSQSGTSGTSGTTFFQLPRSP